MAWSTCGTSSCDVWYDWTSSSCSGKYDDTSNATTWSYWSTASTCSVTSGQIYFTWIKAAAAHSPRPETADERAIREERNRIAQAEREAADKNRREEEAVAEQRAKDLLVATMNEEQKQSFQSERKFFLIGSDGERYEVDCTKRQHNVFAVDAEGRRVREFCLVQTGGTPLSDNHLAQKLLLETDAERFRKVANQWELSPTRRVAA